MKIKDVRIIKKFHGLECKLTKTGSKRLGSMVQSGQSETGRIEILEIDDLMAVQVNGRGFGFLRTSAIVKVIDSTKDIVQFETQGGIYVLERLTESYYE